MASFDLTRYVTSEQDTIDAAVAAIEAKLELIDSTKTIRLYGIVPLHRDRQKCVGFVVYDT